MRIFTDWLGWFFGGFVGFILVETGPLVPFFLWFKRGSFSWPFFGLFPIKVGESESEISIV